MVGDVGSLAAPGSAQAMESCLSCSECHLVNDGVKESGEQRCGFVPTVIAV